MGGYNRLRLIVMLLAFAAAGAAGVARADTPPGGKSPIDQYVEQVPTAKGGKAVITPGGTAGKPLPAKIRAKIRRSGGADADALEILSTSPEYGAPPARAEASAGGRGRDSGKGRPSTAPRDERLPPAAEPPATAGEAAGSITGAASDDGRARLVLLLVAIGAISLALVGVAARRHGIRPFERA